MGRKMKALLRKTQNRKPSDLLAAVAADEQRQKDEARLGEESVLHKPGEEHEAPLQQHKREGQGSPQEREAKGRAGFKVSLRARGCASAGFARPNADTR